jgi:hypothetical protein
MFKIRNLNDDNISIYKVILLDIFSIGIGVEIGDDYRYKFYRFLVFAGIMNINICFDIFIGSQYDFHISFRFF